MRKVGVAVLVLARRVAKGVADGGKLQAEVLVTRRHASADLGGYWEFPGGKVNKGETPEAAALREAHEELGVRVASANLLGVWEHAYAEKMIVLYAYGCEVGKDGGDDVQPRCLAAAEMRWVNAEQLKKLVFPAANVDLLRVVAELMGRMV